MRCPYCKENITIQGKFCPRCGEQIFGLPVDRGNGEERDSDRGRSSEPRQTSQRPRRTPQPPSEDSSSPSPPDVIDLDIDVEDTAEGQDQPAVLEAEEEHVGKTCPYCRFPIKPDEEILVCPECDVPHHADCWEENDGCTTYGCTGGRQPARAYQQTGSGSEGWQRPSHPQSSQQQTNQQRTSSTAQSDVGFTELQGAELEARANNALILSLLGLLCFIPALMGFFMGIRVLGKIRRNPALSNHPARSRAIGALVISGIFLGAWVILFIGAFAGAS